jgi:hypothetical protein
MANCNQTAVELMQTVKPGLVDGKCGECGECQARPCAKLPQGCKRGKATVDDCGCDLDCGKPVCESTTPSATTATAPSTQCVCTKELAPVCFDSVTYNNKCMAKCNQTAVELMQKVRPGLVDGKCGQTKECTKGYELDEKANTCVPVTCDAELACKDTETCRPSKQVCRSKPCKNFICVPKADETTTAPSTQCVCTKELAPVCFDSVTYNNKCMAKCNQTAVRRWRLVRPGLIAGKCKQQKPGEKSCHCTKELALVCAGTVTYTSNCLYGCNKTAVELVEANKIKLSTQRCPSKVKDAKDKGAKEDLLDKIAAAQKERDDAGALQEALKNVTQAQASVNATVAKLKRLQELSEQKSAEQLEATNARNALKGVGSKATAKYLKHLESVEDKRADLAAAIEAGSETTEEEQALSVADLQTPDLLTAATVEIATGDLIKTDPAKASDDMRLLRDSFTKSQALLNTSDKFNAVRSGISKEEVAVIGCGSDALHTNTAGIASCIKNAEAVNDKLSTDVDRVKSLRKKAADAVDTEAVGTDEIVNLYESQKAFDDLLAAIDSATPAQKAALLASLTGSANALEKQYQSAAMTAPAEVQQYTAKRELSAVIKFQIAGKLADMSANEMSRNKNSFKKQFLDQLPEAFKNSDLFVTFEQDRRSRREGDNTITVSIVVYLAENGGSLDEFNKALADLSPSTMEYEIGGETKSAQVSFAVKEEPQGSSSSSSNAGVIVAVVLVVIALLATVGVVVWRMQGGADESSKAHPQPAFVNPTYEEHDMVPPMNNVESKKSNISRERADSFA